jgi:hypothetical protein
LSFFKNDWRYACFLSCGLIGELGAILSAARRLNEQRRQQLHRVLELEDR